MRSIRSLAVGLILIGLSLVLLGCSKSTAQPTGVVVTVPVIETRIVEVTREVEKTVVVTATPVPTPAYTSPINAAPGALVYPLTADPLSLDPQEAYDATSQLVAGQLYEGLFNLNGDGSTVPAAATGFTLSADGTVYTVTLRSGLAWSDGQPLTAQHYVDGVCRVLDPAVGDPFYTLLTDVAPLQGAAAYASGDEADCAKVGITAVDDVTLRLTLARPAAYLPALLALPIFWPAPVTASQALTTTVAVGPPTNGPYLLTEQVPGDHILLTKNPNYWNAAQVAIERIEFKIIPDLAKQLALYEAGDLQVAEFPAAATERIQADPAFAQELQVLVQPGASYLGLNLQAAPTNDVNVRRAIASAIDRQALIDQVLKQSWHVPAQGLLPPETLGANGEDAGYPYNLEAARSYLAEAGYGPEKPIPPVELWYNREGSNELLFKAVGAMLEEAGIPVRLVSSPWEMYLDALEGCNKPIAAAAAKTPAECSYNLYRMGWVMDYADASSLLKIFSPKSRFQYTGWASADYDRLLAQALAEPDQAARAELYRQAEALLLNDVVVIPLQYYDRTVLVKDGIAFDYPPFGPPNLQYWKLRE